MACFDKTRADKEKLTSSLWKAKLEKKQVVDVMMKKDKIVTEKSKMIEGLKNEVKMKEEALKSKNGKIECLETEAKVRKEEATGLEEKANELSVSVERFKHELESTSERVNKNVDLKSKSKVAEKFIIQM